jgi:hypothetical protein
MSRARGPGKQQGAALFVAIVLLVAMAWFALSAFRISSQHLQMVGNSEVTHQAAAQQAIEQTISSNLFTKDPAAVAATPIAVDVDGDGRPDFTAELIPAPKCIRVRPIKTMELDIAQAADRVCLQTSGGTGNLIVTPGAAVASGNSLCAYSEWNVSGQVNDAPSGTTITVNQGVGIRVETANAANFCK